MHKALMAKMMPKTMPQMRPCELSTLRVTLDQHIATVTLNRADKANAMNAAMWQEIRQAFEWVDRTPEVRVAVLQAEGKLFCSGIDLQMMMSMPAQIADDCEGRQREAAPRDFGLARHPDQPGALPQTRAGRHPRPLHWRRGRSGGVRRYALCQQRGQLLHQRNRHGHGGRCGHLAAPAQAGGPGHYPRAGLYRTHPGRGRGAAIGLVNRVFDSRAALYAGVQEIARQIAASRPCRFGAARKCSTTPATTAWPMA